MSNLERLEKERKDMIERHRRERDAHEEKITKEKERVKRQKEAEKKKKEQQAMQNNIAGEDVGYQDFVKNSMSIAEINKKLENFLNS